jgi:hypothetical protein
LIVFEKVEELHVGDANCWTLKDNRGGRRKPFEISSRRVRMTCLPHAYAC